MTKIYFLILIAFTGGASAQKSQRETLSALGANKILPNGVFVSQTIGQLSVIGSHTIKKRKIIQGFQQAFLNTHQKKIQTTSIETFVYPNPFINLINFKFSQPIKEPISIILFDIQGKIVFSQEKLAQDKILSIELPNLASSNYLVRLTATNYTYHTQILKQQ